MTRGDKRIYDGFHELSGGMDSGRNPSIIAVNQSAFLTNATVRGGYLDQRPGYSKITLNFPDPDIQDWFLNRNHQGSIDYDPFLSDAYVVSSIGGRLFKISIVGKTVGNVQEITPGNIAFAILGLGFVMPAVGASVSIVVNDNSGTYGGRQVFVHGAGYFKVNTAPAVATSVITAAPVQPAVGANVVVTMDSTADINALAKLFITGGGYYEVQSKTATTATLKNLGYTVNVSPGAVIPIGSIVRGADMSIQNLGLAINVAPTTAVVVGEFVRAIDNGNSSILPRVYMLQAEQFLIIQDDQSTAIIYDGSLARRAAYDGPRKEVPTGSAMAYGNGRLWVCIKERYFVAGDIVGSTDTGDQKYNFNDSLLGFTENDYLNEGGAFRVPLSTGPITAMRFIATPDTSLGQGPLQIFTPGGVYSILVPVDRTLWKSLQTPVQVVSQIGYGALADRSTILINGDIFYRGSDGLRSYAVTRRSIGQWGHVPISKEMGRILDFDTEWLLSFTSAVLFDNRLLMTCTPVPRPNSCYFLGLSVLDFDLISTLQGQAPPAYDGLWTGLNIVQIFKGTFANRERCFIAAINSAGQNELWEISKEAIVDGGSTRIQSSCETRSMAMRVPETAPGSDTTQFKQLESGEMWIDSVQGEVDFLVQYRPDQYPCWFDWHQWSECQIMDGCHDPVIDAADAIGACQPVRHYRPGYRPRMQLPQPPDDIEEGLEKPARFGCEFQFRIQWLGRARIKALKAFATAVQEDVGGNIVQ